MMPSAPLIVIVGPTASGKTGLAIEVAKALGGEIISADSRAIYKGTDIGTAKPTLAERQGVVHWGFDLVEPGERFTVADFKAYAYDKITDIRSRGKVPIIAGGTGLYIDSVIFNYEFPPEASLEQRKALEDLSVDQLHDYCTRDNIELPENKLNKRYVINTILNNAHGYKRTAKPMDNSIIVGITTERDELRHRIRKRTEGFLSSGVLNEAMRLGAQYGWEVEAMTGNIYPLAHKLQLKLIGEEELVECFNVKEWRLAKRQITWFKRNEHIKWLSLENAYTYIIHEFTVLNNP